MTQHPGEARDVVRSFFIMSISGFWGEQEEMDEPVSSVEQVLVNV